MGFPKAWLPFGNETLLERVVRSLEQTLAPVAVVAAPEQELPPLPGAVSIVRAGVVQTRGGEEFALKRIKVVPAAARRVGRRAAPVRLGG